MIASTLTSVIALYLGFALKSMSGKSRSQEPESVNPGGMGIYRRGSWKNRPKIVLPSSTQSTLIFEPELPKS
ncbi:hypothetical protein [Okeania sp. SIO2B3]|uniref:hypothetical protein n=1 Tax=Okeania sp. SIO2B3 TaxID=2607784 RepID=UPI0013C1D6CD|nr:hypothetical protein [Okeania sp. SIO2B3]NET45186.1 hypothetical protein [Okeania sp. SIO2B3]